MASPQQPTAWSPRRIVVLVCSIIWSLAVVYAVIQYPPQGRLPYFGAAALLAFGIVVLVRAAGRPWGTAALAGATAMALVLAWAAIGGSGVDLEEEPLTAEVLIGNDIAEEGFCDQFAVANPQPDAVPIPSYDKRQRVTRVIQQQWIDAVGGQYAGRMRIEIRIQGKSETAVVLRNPRAVRDEVTQASTSSVFDFQYGCGSAFREHSYLADLDDLSPALVAVAGERAGEVIPAVPFPLAVSSSDPETLLLTVSASAVDVHWHVEIDWSSGGSSGTISLRPPQGGSFVTLGTARVVHEYAPDSGTWMVVER